MKSQTILSSKSPQIGKRHLEVMDELESMLDQGKSFTTMSDLAKKLKISLRTLYEIAPSKEELIVTTVDRVLKKHGKIAMDAMNAHSSPIKKLESFLTGAIQNGKEVMSNDGLTTYFDDPTVIETLEFWKSLSQEHGIMPTGTVEWGTLRQAFLEGQTAMMWHSTGNLTAVKNNASFDFGVAELPANVRKGSPTGGGNFYVFKDTSPEEQAAALKLIEFMTSPEQAAAWSIGTGYMGVSPAAYETDALKTYTEEFPPALVARNQLENAVAEFSTFETARVREGLNNAIQAALTNTKSAADALAEAQASAVRLLRDYQ